MDPLQLFHQIFSEDAAQICTDENYQGKFFLSAILSDSAERFDGRFLKPSPRIDASSRFYGRFFECMMDSPIVRTLTVKNRMFKLIFRNSLTDAVSFDGGGFIV